MKPHIRRRYSIWECCYRLPDWRGHRVGKVGYGYTPAEAYAEWLEVK